MSDEQIAQVDAWLLGYKQFDGFQPPWIAVSGRGRDWEANWPIVGGDGISSAYGALEADATLTTISISIIYRGAPVYRLDMVPPDKREGNEFPVIKYAPQLPREFLGTHAHAWDDHRKWVQEQGLGQLPFRRPILPAPNNFDRGMEHVANAINLTLLPAHRPIQLPPQFGFSVRGGS